MDIVVWRARRALADVLGLIGRHWLMFLGWALFALAISEPVRAFGHDACTSRASAISQCESDIVAYYSGDQVPPECRVGAGSSSGASGDVELWRYYGSCSAPACAFKHGAYSWTCPACGSYPPEANEGGAWNWPGDESHTECFGGCNYVPAPGSTSCGNVSAEFEGSTIVGDTFCVAELLMPNGTSCGDSPLAPDSPDDLPPPPDLCADPGDGSLACFEPQQVCITTDGVEYCITVGEMPTTVAEPPPPDDGTDISAGDDPPPMPTDPSEPPKHTATATTTVDGVTTTYTVSWSPPGWNPDGGSTDVDDARDAPPDEDGDGIPDGQDDDANGDGKPDGVPDGDPDGECDPETGEGCGEGEADGGVDCIEQPLCTGDAVTCMVAFQTWKTRCEVDSLSKGVIGEDDPEPLGTDVDTWDADSLAPMPQVGSLNASGGLSASCSPLTVNVMGEVWEIDFCDLLALIGGLVMVAGYYVAARVLLGGN